MGILSSYLWYRSGRSAGARRTVEELEQELEELFEPCRNCGHMAMQHSRDGRARCPSYD